MSNRKLFLCLHQIYLCEHIWAIPMLAQEWKHCSKLLNWNTWIEDWCSCPFWGLLSLETKTNHFRVVPLSTADVTLHNFVITVRIMLRYWRNSRFKSAYTIKDDFADWKTANLTTCIIDKHEKSEAPNYWPVSLTKMIRHSSMIMDHPFLHNRF